jgi:hypothetical protein
LFLRQPLPNPAPARYNGARKSIARRITPGGLPSSSTSLNLRPARADEAIEWRSLFAAPHESGYGTFRTSRDVRVMSAFRGRSEVAIALPDFRV